jgi:predicted permease
MRDVRLAVRALRAWPAGAAAAIATLAIAIAATTSVYSFLRLTLDDLAGVPAIDRVARIYAGDSPGGGRRQVALADVDSTLSRAASFESIGAYAQADGTVGAAGDTQRVTVGIASPSFFAAVGIPAARGRLFTSADTAPPRRVAIVSDALWRRRFSDRGLAGASILVDGDERSVVGIMPPGFSFGLVGITADLWLPLDTASSRAPRDVTVFARLRPGAHWSAAAAELDAVGEPGRKRWRAIPIDEDRQHRAVGQSLLTFGPALVVLLIGCVNVSCMLMARGIERGEELCVRRALGATRACIVRQLLLEAAILALAGGVIGAGLSTAILRVLASAMAAIRPDVADRVAVGWGLLPEALAATAAACVLAGTVPALRLSREDVGGLLKGMPSATSGAGAGYGARDLIVFAETGLAVALVAFAAMLFNLFDEMRRVTALFPADQVVGVEVAVRDVEEIERRVAALPGVASVVVASALPGSAVAWRGAAQAQAMDGRTLAVTRIPARATFFTTLGLPLLRGRTFDATEDGTRAGVTVLSESAARLLAPDADPLGLRVRIAGRSMVVIGVCRDAVEFGGLGRAGFIPPDAFVPYEPPASHDPILLARVAAGASGVARLVATASRTASNQAPRTWLVTERLRLPGASGEGAMVSRLLGAFALVALLLAASGMFGVISQSVAQRRTEFGIRMALGAAPRSVLGMVLVREATLTSAALASGTMVTFAVARATFAEFARLSAASPAVWCATVLLCGSVATFTCLLATRRIVRLEPWVVLRRS